MSWLVTGGAGYIGAHVARAMLDQGHQVVVIDDMSTGLASRVDERAVLVEGSVLDPAAVRQALHGVEGVVHIAAKKQVGESVADPLMYYRENVGGMGTLLEACRETGVDKVVFSSSCSVYGMPDQQVVTEQAPTRPLSPYGESKLMCEQLLRWSQEAYGIRSVSLRYFNVAGAGSPQLGDPCVLNLIPIVFDALDAGRPVQVFGDQHPTPDGTCIRDYVHVSDLARAHLAAADALVAGAPSATFNVGRGVGSSVLEVLRVIEQVTGREVPYEVVAARRGDPGMVTASVTAIAEALGFRTDFDLEAIVSSAWDAWRSRELVQV